MVKTFQYSIDRRIANRIIIWLLKAGFAPRFYYLLTVRGRITGKPHSVPVVVIEEDQTRWLVAPYGEVDWVKNARASGTVTLTRQKSRENYLIRELPIDAAAPVLKKYLQLYPLTKPYFEAQAGDPPCDFLREAKSKPVFELV